jgi:meiotically up-regulated gene 157 (Mug157) protein
VIDRQERYIPINTVDEFLVLTGGANANATVLVLDKTRHFTAGTVLAIEGFTATRFESFRSWLTHDSEMFASLWATTSQLTT